MVSALWRLFLRRGVRLVDGSSAKFLTPYTLLWFYLREIKFPALSQKTSRWWQQLHDAILIQNRRSIPTPELASNFSNSNACCVEVATHRARGGNAHNDGQLELVTWKLPSKTAPTRLSARKKGRTKKKHQLVVPLGFKTKYVCCVLWPEAFVRCSNWKPLGTGRPAFKCSYTIQQKLAARFFETWLHNNYTYTVGDGMNKRANKQGLTTDKKRGKFVTGE